MPSLQALPPELFHYIIDILIEKDITGTSSLLQTCRGYSLSEEYDKVRYLSLWKKSGYPPRKKLPRNIRQEADLLQAARWPSLPEHIKDHRKEFVWEKVPSFIQQNGATTVLSNAARLIGERIYDVSENRLTLLCFEFIPWQADHHQSLCKPNILHLGYKILSYDVDQENGSLAVLAEVDEVLQLTIHESSLSSPTILQSGIVGEIGEKGSFAEVIMNQSSIMVSLENNITVYDWKRESELIEIWSRKTEEMTLAGWYIRANLLSSQVVACTVLATFRTIGSMRVHHGLIELYRLDQHVPRVADIVLPEAFVDALQPRILQDPFKYISFDLGGKTALQNCLKSGFDGPAIVQVFSDTRVGKLSTLCDILYPKAALALYSFDPTKPSYPVLGNEWLRSNFPLLRGASPLQSSLHGLSMISATKQGRNELMYWTFSPKEDHVAESMQVTAVENFRPLLSLLGSDQDERYHVDLVSLSGPRALFTCFKCFGQQNGTVYATEPLCSFWGTFEPSPRRRNLKASSS